MKKIIIAVFLTTLVVTGVFGQNGIIRELTGDVELKHAGSSVFVNASAGDTIAPDTIVSTGFRSTAIIEVGASLITARPLTRLSFVEILKTGNTEDVNVSLQTGRVRVEVTPPAGTRTNMTVQSPSATASVRGTIFEMDVQNMNTVEGKVILSGSSGTGVIVTEGNSSSATLGGTVSDPATVAAASTQPTSPVGTPSPDIIATVADSGPGDVSVDIRYDGGSVFGAADR